VKRIKISQLSLYFLVLPLCLLNYGCVWFSDEFDRPDHPDIGNGWIEKNPNAFSISENTVLVNGSVLLSYRDNIVYRPAADDSLDLRVSMELLLSQDTPGFPQLHLRVQRDAVASLDTLDSYVLFIDNENTRAVLGRQRGTNFADVLATLAIDPPLNTTDRFRLSLQALGTETVFLKALIERFDADVWLVIGKGQASDASEVRIASPGSYGFSGFLGDAYRIDNFQKVGLSLEGGESGRTSRGLRTLLDRHGPSASQRQ
jgi:hypothetical protein